MAEQSQDDVAMVVYNLRVPAAIYARLKSKAAADKRRVGFVSLNTMICTAIDEWLDRQESAEAGDTNQPAQRP